MNLPKKKSSFDWASFESLLRQGQQQSVRETLSRIKAKNVPISDAHLFANQLRRSGESLRAIRYLGSFLSSDSKKSKLPFKSGPIQAELAATLNAIGAPEQAATILKNLNATDYPKISLYRAFVSISRWEYVEAKNEIAKYLPMATDSYDEITAKSNLAACEVALGSNLEAQNLLVELEEKISKGDYKFLESNILLLKAQHLIQQEKPSAAQSILVHLLSITRSPTTLLLIGKWMWVVQVSLCKSLQERQKHLVKWEELQSKAQEMRLTEVARDLDLKRALHFKDVQLLKKVFHGTPFPQYKVRIKTEAELHFDMKLDLKEEFRWSQNIESSDKSKIEHFVNLESGQTQNPKVFFKKESTLHKLFKVLSSDLYRAWGAPSIHSALFPDMIYNPNSSPGLVFEHVQRLRRFLNEKRIGAEILRKANFFFVQLKPKISLIYNSQDSLSGEEFLWMADLKSEVKGDSFTLQAAEKFWKIPKRSLQRRLQKLVKKGLITLNSRGKNSTYNFAP